MWLIFGCYGSGFSRKEERGDGHWKEGQGGWDLTLFHKVSWERRESQKKGGDRAERAQLHFGT